MKARRLKELLGWYAARTRKGGAARSPHYAPHVQAGTPAHNDETCMAVARLLAKHAGTQERIGRWLRAATTSDGAVYLSGHDKRLRREFAAEAVTLGLLEPPFHPSPVEDHEWQTVPERIPQRTLKFTDA